MEGGGVDGLGDSEEQCGPDRSGTTDLAIVTLVLQQMTLLESRLVRRLDENAKLLAGRWDHHDREHIALETRMATYEARLGEHLKAEEREHIEFDARVKPVVSLAGLVKREWRTIVIVMLLLFDGFAQIRSAMGF